MSINIISNTDRQKFTSVLNNYRAEFQKHEEQQRQYAKTRNKRYTNIVIVTVVISIVLLAIYKGVEYNSRPEVIAARQEAVRVAEQERLERKRIAEQKRIEAEKRRQEEERWERIGNSERFRRDVVAIARENDFFAGRPKSIKFDGAQVYAYYEWIYWTENDPAMLFCSDGIRCGKVYYKTDELMYIHFVSYADLSKARNDYALRRKIQNIFSDLPDQDDVQGAIRDLINLNYESY